MLMLKVVAKVDCMLKLSIVPCTYVEARVFMFSVAAPIANTAVAFH